MKKNGKRPMGLIIVIVILGIGLLVGGYFLSNQKEKPKPVKKELTEEMKEYSKKLGDLYKGVTNADANYCGFYKLFTDKKMTVKDLNNEEIGKIITFNLYKASGKTNMDDWENTVYSKVQVENMVKSVFGSDTSFTHGTISGCPSLEYNSSNGEYKVVVNDCDSSCDEYNTRSIIVKSMEKKEGLEIFSRVVFGGKNSLYGDYAKTKKIATEDSSAGIASVNFDKGSLYKIVFKLENDNYVLSYVEPSDGK